MAIQPLWEQIVSQKRAIRDKLLTPYLINVADRETGDHVDKIHERSHVDEEAQAITDIDEVEVLLQRIQTGDFSAEQVVKAYIQR
jgi:hypothetical protein